MNVQSGSDAGQDDGNALLRIEGLLEEQAKHNQKMLRANRIRTVALVVFVVLAILLAVMVYTKIADLNTAIQKIEMIDFEEINQMVSNISGVAQGIEKINFTALNESIEALAEGVSNFRTFIETLSNPFGWGA